MEICDIHGKTYHADPARRAVVDLMDEAILSRIWWCLAISKAQDRLSPSLGSFESKKVGLEKSGYPYVAGTNPIQTFPLAPLQL